MDRQIDRHNDQTCHGVGNKMMEITFISDFSACYSSWQQHSNSGLKISFTGPSDKMSGDEVWVGHMSDDLQFSFDSKISLNDTNK
jgi:hypothetical protein